MAALEQQTALKKAAGKPNSRELIWKLALYIEEC
jgi:hypothetical protein